MSDDKRAESQSHFGRVARWAAFLAVPAVILGVAMYPDIQQRTMPLALASGVLALTALGFIFARRPHYIVLLPLVASYLPSLQVGFVAYTVALAYAVVAFGPARLVRPLDAVDGAFLAVLLLAAVSWLINLGSETDAWSFPFFALTFLAPWLLLFFSRAGKWSRSDLAFIICLWLALAASQLAPALIKPALTGMPEAYLAPIYLLDLSQSRLLSNLVLGNVADLTSGSMRSAHHLGIALLIAAVVAGMWRTLHATGRLLALAVALLFVFLMTDSKHVMLAAVPASLLAVIPLGWTRLDGSARRVAGAVAVVAGAGMLLWAAPQLVSLGRQHLWEPYASLAHLNPKLRLIMRTEERLGRDPLALWLGFGPGSFASRAATIRATDVLYKGETQAPGFIPPHTGDSYGAVARGLYTSAIARSSRFRSGALTNPFSSLVGILAEFGIVGSAAMICFFGTLTWRGYRCWQAADQALLVRAAGAGLGVAMPLLLAAGLFDSYFEQPDVTAPIMTLGLVVLASRVRRAGEAQA